MAQHTAGAIRAAERFLDVKRFGPDAEKVDRWAEIIDNETGAREMLEALSVLSRLESSARAVADWTHARALDEDDEMADLLGDLWQDANEARAAIARAKGRTE